MEVIQSRVFVSAIRLTAQTIAPLTSSDFSSVKVSLKNCLSSSREKYPRRLMTAKNDLAVVLTEQGDFDEAEHLLTELWEVRKERWPDDYPGTLGIINAFGVLRRQQKK